MQAWYETLKKHVIGAWGELGQQWLEQLPQIIARLAEQWHLSDIKPIQFPSYNYVAFCKQHDDLPIVLKISCDAQLIADEYKMHKHFNGQHAVRVFAYDDQLHAVLLEMAVPGEPLREMNRNQAIPIYANIVKQLHDLPQDKADTYSSYKTWLKALDNIEDSSLMPFVSQAKLLIQQLEQHPQPLFICHANLHLQNIISHQDQYVAIDPKGVVGELAFELSSFNLLTMSEIKANKEMKELIQHRLAGLAVQANCDKQRLLAWFYLRVLIHAQWFCEDQGDFSQNIILLQHLQNLLE